MGFHSADDVPGKKNGIRIDIGHFPEGTQGRIEYFEDIVFRFYISIPLEEHGIDKGCPPGRLHELDRFSIHAVAVAWGEVLIKKKRYENK